MSNEIQLQTNNTKLDTLTSLAQIMRGKVANLPDASGSDSGGASVEIIEVTLRRSSNPTSANFVSSVLYTNINSDGLLHIDTVIPSTYLSIYGCVSNTLMFIATQNSPSACTVSGNLELISFNSSVGAVIKVIGSDANAGIATVSDPSGPGGGDTGGESSLAGTVQFR